MRISTFQPDIPQNLGALLRVSACLNVPLDIIEPCGFAFSEKKLKRTAMDYINHADFRTFIDYQAFKVQQQKESPNSRVILLTTKSEKNYLDFRFQKNDRLLLGRESAGVPKYVHESVDGSVTIEMPGIGRSLNVVVSCVMVLSEAIRQTRDL
jgi:tRNA (cytidine/uridine-2'-O-)-methyltransferase